MKSVKDFFDKEFKLITHAPAAKKFIRKYYTDNLDVLASNGYSVAPVFGNVKRKTLLSILKVDESKFAKFAKTHPVLKMEFRLMNDVLSISLLLLYAETKDEIFLHFMAIKEHTSKFNKYFKHKPDESKMSYVINNLSGRYLVSKHLTLDKTMTALLKTMKASFGEKMYSSKDDDLFQIINSLSTRINLMTKNIAREFYKTDDKHFYKEKEILSKENLRLTTTETLKFESLINTVRQKEINTGFDAKLAKKIKVDKFRTNMEICYKKHISDISNIVKMLVTDFLSSSPSVSIEESKRAFLAYSLVNKRRNPEIAIILDKMIKENGFKYGNKFRFALIKYLIVRIHKELIEM